MRLNRLDAVTTWLERVDPGTHRRIKGLRLVTAYGIAVALDTLHDVTADVPSNLDFGTLAGGFALWASVSEGRATRFESSRDLVILYAAAAAGAGLFALLSPLLSSYGRPGIEAILISGAFLAAYLKRFGLLGAGVGSQIYIGQLLAFSFNLGLLRSRGNSTLGHGRDGRVNSAACAKRASRTSDPFRGGHGRDGLAQPLVR